MEYKRPNADIEADRPVTGMWKKRSCFESGYACVFEQPKQSQDLAEWSLAELLVWIIAGESFKRR